MTIKASKNTRTTLSPQHVPPDMTTMYLDMTLPRAQALLSSKIVDMQVGLANVANDITRYGSSTKTNVLPNLLAEVLSLHEKVAVLVEVERLHREDKLKGSKA